MKKFSIHEFLKTRPLSWSAISSFQYNPEEWYEKYILGKKFPESAEMLFGKKVALSIENGTCEVPGLLKILQKKKEHEFKVVFNKIPLIGFADAFCDKKFRNLDEVKTGIKPWDKKRADGHGQITLYALFNFVSNKIKPEDTIFTVYWIPTVKHGDFSVTFADPVRFVPIRTTRTMQDVVKFGALINETVAAMEAYVRNHA